MKPWTTEEEAILRELCYYGAGAVRDAIEERCGTRRTVHAIEAHASRIHVSLKVLEECPLCHAVGVRLNRLSHLCPRCTEEMHIAEEQAFHDLLQAEAEGCEDGPELEELQQRYATLRQQNSRLRRKYGLRGKRERGI